MLESKIEKNIQSILTPIDIEINGTRPWDIQVHNAGFYERILSGGSLALGESYMDGWWDCEALDQFFKKILDARLDKKIRINSILFL
nr:cyclopropane-fatty-acyl-phospholipid synthase [Desulfobacula sp.]